MMNANDFEYTGKIIDITPEENIDTSCQQETENPVIIIESDEENAKMQRHQNANGRGNSQFSIFNFQFGKWLIGIGIALLIMVIACAGWQYYRHNYYVGMPVSCTPSENIEKLQASSFGDRVGERSGVVFTHDSIGTVALNMYQLCGLKADITFDEPDTLDQSVYFYTRCADYDKKGHIIGSMVIDGKEISDDNTRLGYCAMLGGNTVIGIARSEKVRDYVEDNGGSFFRQFILVSNGEIPTVFHLHKKVERRALARMDDQLYYIESCHAETMWDFADAIRKYGFIDAIYITGGDAPSYYRTSAGERYAIGNPANAPSKRTGKYAPWLVFRKK